MPIATPILDRLNAVAFKARCEETAEWLFTLPDDTFDQIVELDLTNALDVDLADILGHPIAVLRWSDVLKAKHVALSADLAAHPGDQWKAYRRRLMARSAVLVDRRAKAKHAKVSASADRVTRNQMSNHDPNDRRTAGERARDHLIALHVDEFEALLADELAKDAVQ